MNRGSVRQRHTADCPRDAEGRLRRHRCREPWEYVIDTGRTTKGRRRQSTKSGFETKRAAQEALVERQRELSIGIAPLRLTTGAYLDQWLESKRALRPGTVKSYSEHIELHIKPGVGHLQMRALTADDIDRMLGRLLRRKKLDGSNMSTATVRRVHATLRTALNSAVKRRLIAYNPALAVELPVERRDPSSIWTAAQVRAFLTETADDELGALYHVVAMTGLRRGEVTGLRWIDVDLQGRTLRVEQQVVELAGKTHIGPPKTRSGRRTVALDQTTCDVLSAHKERQDRARVTRGDAWVESGLVFTRDNGRMLVPEYVSRQFRRATKRAGLPPLRFHDLRHTAASLALAAGVPLRVVSDRLGHSTIGITADLYTHVLPAVQRDAADALEQLLKSARDAADAHDVSEM